MLVKLRSVAIVARSRTPPLATVLSQPSWRDRPQPPSELRLYLEPVQTSSVCSRKTHSWCVCYHSWSIIIIFLIDRFFSFCVTPSVAWYQFPVTYDPPDSQHDQPHSPFDTDTHYNTCTFHYNLRPTCSTNPSIADCSWTNTPDLSF